MERLDDTQIIVAGPGDAAGLAEVHVTAWRETYAGLLPAPYLARMSVAAYARRWRGQLMAIKPAEIVLATEGRSGIVGYCAAHAAGNRGAEVSTLYLIRTAQRRGLGRRMLAAAARVVEAQGADSLTLWVLNGNSPARAFYEHLGGVAVGERLVRGWGGDLMETAMHWSQIAGLSRL